MNTAIIALIERIGRPFTQPALLIEALTHPSYANEHPSEGAHNQRLEFLGDAVLQIIMSRELYFRYPTEREGVLSRRRSVLTKGPCLAGLAREIGLDAALRLGSSEDATGGRTRLSNLEDGFEAMVGALYLDAGLEETHRLVLALYGPLEPRLAVGLVSDNPKGRLQEWVHPRHGNTALQYVAVHVGGADHEREYRATVLLNGAPVGEGTGTSKKSAEEAAARAACAALILPA